jgi:hypothetical protein
MRVRIHLRYHSMTPASRMTRVKLQWAYRICAVSSPSAPLANRAMIILPVFIASKRSNDLNQPMMGRMFGRMSFADSADDHPRRQLQRPRTDREAHILLGSPPRIALLSRRDRTDVKAVVLRTDETYPKTRVMPLGERCGRGLHFSFPSRPWLVSTS